MVNFQHQIEAVSGSHKEVIENLWTHFDSHSDAYQKSVYDLKFEKGTVPLGFILIVKIRENIFILNTVFIYVYIPGHFGWFYNNPQLIVFDFVHLFIKK